MSDTTKSHQAVVVQTGGCSAVINSTLAGIVTSLQKEGWSIKGYRNAFEGLLHGDAVDLTSYTEEQIERLRRSPGAYLGSSRLFLTPEIFAAIPRKLHEAGCEVLLMIGGNGTMYAANKILENAKEQQIPLRVIGVPKTVDNDLVGVSYAPGFGSAARYIAQAVRDIGMDLASMKTFEQIRIVEVMGRSAGWLAAASGLAALGGCHVPHRIYLPEHDFDEQDFLQKLKHDYQQHGYSVVVVGEGIHTAAGKAVGAVPFSDVKQASRIYGGAAHYLSERVHDVFGLRARAIDLNMPQRCFGPLRAKQDEFLAYTLGVLGGRAAVQGISGKMVNCKADGSSISLMPLMEVAGVEQHVPEKYYDAENNQVTDEFLKWLQVITGPMPDEYITLPDEAVSLETAEAKVI